MILAGWQWYLLGFGTPFVFYALVVLGSYAWEAVRDSHLLERSAHCFACDRDFTPGFMLYVHGILPNHRRVWRERIRRELVAYISSYDEGSTPRSIEEFYIRAGRRYGVEEWHRAREIADENERVLMKRYRTTDSDRSDSDE